MEEFTVEIAGVPVGIRCRYPENRKFLREYLSEKDPLLFIGLTDGDLQRQQDQFERWDVRDGITPQ
ncbi:MAG: hypothetical protein IKP86_10975 [Anaerolineaceae bacterium]|nr:hypothetical protein [Anaerolineaceae bacterium]